MEPPFPQNKLVAVSGQGFDLRALRESMSGEGKTYPHGFVGVNLI